jgi:hypothetical protein
LIEPSRLVVAAAANNAHWCDIVCRAHGAATEFAPHAWRCRSAAPPLYPNLVTLDGSAPAQQAAQLRAIEGLQSLDLPTGWAVKDSFRSLDLAPRGFEMLFEAFWIVRDPAAPMPASPFGAAAIDDPAGLVAWESAWRRDEPTGDNELPARLFPDALLAHPDVAFLAIRRDGRIVAGAAVNRGAGVAGVTNLFFGDEPPATIAGAISAAIASRFPGLPIVDYEQADRAQELRRAEFRILARLAVWLAG